MEDYSVRVMSREIVKPSSQIHNDHPKTLKLSYLDQLTTPIYVNVIFFYQANEFTSNHAQISQKLKHSLSQTLATFYPLAGRVNGEDNTIVDCNDAGVEFIEARAHAQLADALANIDIEDESKLQYIPIDVANYKHSSISEKPFLYVQTTFFDCGGIALGICCSHVFADFHSIMMFINAWASICRSDGIPQTVSFDMAHHFPARELPDIGIRASDPQLNKKMTRTKMLVFDKEKIALLKKEGVSSTVKDPTRVEVISAFIWEFMMQIHTNPVIAVHAVNVRGRKTLLENVFGNCVFAVSSNYGQTLPDPSHADDEVVEFRALVNKLRRSIRKIDDDYITKSQNGDEYLNDAYRMHCDMHCSGEIEGCYISSWCRFPYYQVDFGFGTPVFFCPVVERIYNNSIVLVSRKTGEDIQAWVTMEHHILQMLQNQFDIISTTTTV